MSLYETNAGSALTAVISNPRLADNPIIGCKDAFIALTFYEHVDNGMRLPLVPGTGTGAALIETIRTALREPHPTSNIDQLGSGKMISSQRAMTLGTLASPARKSQISLFSMETRPLVKASVGIRRLSASKDVSATLMLGPGRQYSKRS